MGFVSRARTVPSSEEETRARPCGRKQTPLTGAVCSEKVTMQKPDEGLHSLTWLGLGVGVGLGSGVRVS